MRGWPLFWILMVGWVLGVAMAHAEEVDIAQPLVSGPGVTLTTKEAEQAVASLPLSARQALLADPDNLRELLDNLYLTMALAGYAESENLEQHPGVAAQLWRERLVILSKAALAHYTDNHPGVDYELVARERYLLDSEAYRQPEERRASHILMDENDKNPEARLMELREQILSGDLDFEQAAKQYSRDPVTAAKGGSLGWFGTGQMLPAFSEAAFALTSIGELGLPVETAFGFHLIRLDGIREARQQPFEEVKERIIAQVRQEHAKTLRDEFISQLANDPAKTVNEQALRNFYESLRTNSGPDGEQ